MMTSSSTSPSAAAAASAHLGDVKPSAGALMQAAAAAAGNAPADLYQWVREQQNFASAAAAANAIGTFFNLYAPDQ